MAARDFQDLGLRAVSGFSVAAVAALAVWHGGVASTLLASVIAGLACWELHRVVNKPHPDALLFGAAGAGGPFVALTAGPLAALFWLALVSFALWVWELRARRPGWTAPAALLTFGLAAAWFAAMRMSEPLGMEAAFWIAVVVAAADIGGYFAGRLVGGPKLWPRVSPKKTWAGLMGGLALAGLAGLLFSWATTGTFFLQVCTVSVLAALLAQGGDLAESAFKRRFGVKDSSGLMPGHGGVMDRVDGLCAATLVIALVSFLRVKPVFVW